VTCKPHPGRKGQSVQTPVPKPEAGKFEKMSNLGEKGKVHRQGVDRGGNPERLEKVNVPAGKTDMESGGGRNPRGGSNVVLRG